MLDFTQIEFWYWLILAITFIAIEVYAPGAIFLWMGVAAGVVGVLLYLFPGLSWEYQLLIFALLSVASVALWRVYRHRNPVVSAAPTLNRRGSELIGRVVTLSRPIEGGAGHETIGGVIWKVSGEDLPAGTKVRITAVEGTALHVEPEKTSP